MNNSMGVYQITPTFKCLKQFNLKNFTTHQEILDFQSENLGKHEFNLEYVDIDEGQTILLIEPLSETVKNVKHASHEIKNALAIIVSCIFITKKLVQKDKLKIEMILDSLDEVVRSTKNISSITEALIAKTLSEEIIYSLSLSDLDFYIKSDLKSYLKSQKVELKYKCNVEELDLVINTYDINFSQVLLNFAKNSVEAFTSSDSRLVEIEIDIVHNELNLTFKDSGPGVPSDLKTKIFKSDFTTKGDEGDGIGLHLCQKSIEKSNGTLSYIEQEIGALFKVQLPIKRAS